MRREYFLEKLRQIFKRCRACSIVLLMEFTGPAMCSTPFARCFKGPIRSQDQIDLNEIILEILEPMGAELKNHGIHNSSTVDHKHTAFLRQ